MSGNKEEQEVKNTIRQLRKIDSYFHEQVMRFIIEGELDKQWKKCNSGISDECLKVDRASEFHGRMCKACKVVYKRELYAKKNKEVKRERISKSGTRKQSNLTQTKSQRRSRSRSVSFKKGTKKGSDDYRDARKGKDSWMSK
jgi:hypothetical protein